MIKYISMKLKSDKGMKLTIRIFIKLIQIINLKPKKILKAYCINDAQI